MSIINTLIKPVGNGTVIAPRVHTVGNLALAVEHEASDVLKNRVKEKFDVRSYFLSKGFGIDISRQNVCIAPVENLAF